MNKTLRAALYGLAAILMLVTTFASGFATGYFVPLPRPENTQALLPAPATATPIVAPTVSPESQTATPQDLQRLFQPFWESWQIVHDYYVDQPVDDTKLMQGAIRGMIESLGDEHSSYMTQQEYTSANEELAGAYEGIGAYVDTSGDYLTIVSPMPGSPAEKAGLKPGDQIIAIDGEDMTGTAPELVRLKVLGPAKTVVHLTVAREGESDTLEFDVTRDQIDVPSVEGKMLDNGLAYIKLSTFGDTTTAELKSTLTTLMAENPKGLILDLRFNGGGYLQTAIEVASQFIGKGALMFEQYGDGTRHAYDAIPGGLATDIPMVVLINEGSASASEIVAGAIQDYGRGQLVGVTSYGKGSVQNWIALKNDQGAVRVTIAKWLTPKGRTIHHQGLTPDVTVEMTQADYDAGLDPQLDKAEEVLLQTIAATPTPEGSN